MLLPMVRKEFVGPARHDRDPEIFSEEMGREFYTP